MAKMESKAHPHEELINGVYEQLKIVLEESKQAIYVYLDDHHMTYNQRFASLLGYKSVEELSKVREPFIEAFVMDKSQEILVHAYRHAMEDKIGSCIEISLKKKTGESINVKIILVPISYMGELLALHFISKI
ncbi:MAG: PAS domain-containing protein [Candidatus Methanoperedens sp.]|nr:PAS domain-containing protein [Candidatus Methanoperedens sp.]MCZ7361094.1 PAS domain-containing protein [Candidatus Methanoperedens sp.]HLB72187.1 PAS domain-containing protein [Candidatus Methanoperedens sp.]